MANWKSLDLKTLQRGQIIRHKSNGKSHVVDAVFGDRATAVSTVDVANPSELEVLATEIKRSEGDKQPD